MNETVANEAQQKLPQLKLMALIMDAEKSEKLCDFLKESHVPVLHQFRAEGTASSEMLDVLGLGGSDQCITFCVMPGSLSRHLMTEAVIAFKLRIPGNGIAFTVPLSGVSIPIVKLLSEDFQARLDEESSELLKKIKSRLESEVEKVKQDIKHHMIVAVINHGYSEELMAAARESGATGGTVIHARRVGGEEMIKLLGISAHAEKEIVAILAPKETKTEIMKAIGQSCGITSEAQGLIFSLPVDEVAGLSDE